MNERNRNRDTALMISRSIWVTVTVTEFQNCSGRDCDTEGPHFRGLCPVACEWWRLGPGRFRRPWTAMKTGVSPHCEGKLAKGREDRAPGILGCR
jgi:hypothetical protein